MLSSFKDLFENACVILGFVAINEKFWLDVAMLDSVIKNLHAPEFSRLTRAEQGGLVRTGRDSHLACICSFVDEDCLNDKAEDNFTPEASDVGVRLLSDFRPAPLEVLNIDMHIGLSEVSRERHVKWYAFVVSIKEGALLGGEVYASICKVDVSPISEGERVRLDLSSDEVSVGVAVEGKCALVVEGDAVSSVVGVGDIRYLTTDSDICEEHVFACTTQADNTAVALLKEFDDGVEPDCHLLPPDSESVFDESDDEEQGESDDSKYGKR